MSLLGKFQIQIKRQWIDPPCGVFGRKQPRLDAAFIVASHLTSQSTVASTHQGHNGGR